MTPTDEDICRRKEGSGGGHPCLLKLRESHANVSIHNSEVNTFLSSGCIGWRRKGMVPMKDNKGRFLVVSNRLPVTTSNDNKWEIKILLRGLVNTGSRLRTGDSGSDGRAHAKRSKCRPESSVLYQRRTDTDSCRYCLQKTKNTITVLKLRPVAALS